MCELLGMSANVPTDIVFSFTGLMQRGGRTGPHRDGWGIGFYEGRGLRLFQDPRASSESEVAQLVQRYPIKSEVVIGHIRQANVGKVCLCQEMQVMTQKNILMGIVSFLCLVIRKNLFLITLKFTTKLVKPTEHLQIVRISLIRRTTLSF